MEINYFKEFLHSKLHYWIGGICGGLLLLSGNIFVAIISLVAYGLALTFIHEMPFFKKMVDAKYNDIQAQEDQVRIGQFRAKRDRQVASLNPVRRKSYAELASLCKEIESSTLDQIPSQDAASNVRLKKIDELMFTYLKLLVIEQSLEGFIDSETEEDVPAEIEQAQKQVDGVQAEMNKMKESNKVSASLIESKQRLLTSYGDRLEVLRKRHEQFAKAKDNIKLVSAEQSRLEEQIKLLKADTIANRNAESISDRIDQSVTHLDETNEWLGKLNEFNDVVGEIPPSNTRIGFDIPYVEQKTPARTKNYMSKTC